MTNAAATKELAGVRVLVVDDDEDTLEVMKVMLELCGAEVMTADSARKALELYFEARPKIVVSDIAMPKEDGYWLIREIGARLGAEPARLKAVAVTAFADLHSRSRALAAGFRDHLSKPVDQDVLCQAVATLARA